MGYSSVWRTHCPGVEKAKPWLLTLWQSRFIYKQVDRPPNVPAFLPEVVLPDQAFPHHQLEERLLLIAKAEYAWPEPGRRQATENATFADGPVCVCQQRAAPTIQDTRQSCLPADQSPLPSRRNTPPPLLAPDGHHLANNVARLQENGIPPKIVVPARCDACRRHTDDAMHNCGLIPSKSVTDYVAPADGSFAVTTDF